MSGKVTAFVSHSDCARHDTGWGHPDHQGRLPSVMRTVYRDMIDLNEPLLDLEGRHATEQDLLRFHEAGYLDMARDWVQEAAGLGKVIEPIDGLRVSDATWDASTAAAGSVLTAIDAVLAGQVRNAFCATRPAGSDAAADSPGRFGLVNPVAVAARYLVEECEMAPVLVFHWTPGNPGRLRGLEMDGEIETLSLERRDSGRGAWPARVEATLNQTGGRRPPAFLILVADFGPADGEMAGTEVHAATLKVREYAERVCEGRLVSVLDHGYGPSLGAAVVQHLRALIGLPPKAD